MQERRIFLELLDRNSPEERAAFLKDACRGDSGLRQRLEALLERHDSLERPPPIEIADDRETAIGRGETEHALTAADRAAASDGTAAAGVAVSLDLRPGMVFQHYEIRGLLGRGGAGTVFEAFDTKLSRRVALKFVSPELVSDESARERFVREARSAASVDHPHVVTIFAIEDGESPYLAMEFIPGETLATRLESVGSLSTREILNIGRQIASGLAAAHGQGVIHRDLKPGNILLNREKAAASVTPYVVIADFGLARAANDAEITKTGYIAGTPAYMSPEQALGRPLDVRSDLFSLGSVLYAMCVGQAPFRADTVVAVLRSVVDDQHPTIADLSPEIPPSLAAIVDRLMSKDPADRFQSAGEAEAALTEALDEFNGAPPDARSAGMARKATHGARLTTRHWTAIAALAFLVLLAGFVVKITSRDGSTVEVTSPDGKPLQLNVGGTRIEIKADGGTSPLTPPSNRTGPDASSGESSPSRSPDLQAAEAVIALGGRVGVRTPDKSVFDVGPLAGIPDGAFQVTEVHLERVRLPVDALSCLQGLEFLESIDMQQGNCSAAHLEHLPQLPALRHIGLYHAVEIDDDAVELLSQHESITVLHLHGARLTNHGLAALTRMRQLVGVWLNDTQVDDSGLPILAELPNLRMLDLSRTKVSADGVRSLHQRLPVCHISSVFDAEELALPEPPSGPELIQNPVLRSLVAASDEWEWTVLQPLGNGINSPGDEGQPCLSADGLTLWWQGTNAADGSWDLYESKRESTAEEFASPMVLPPPINSPEVEVSPSLTVDGRDLFFVSNRRGGRGELDIWSARRNSIDAPFGEPANLGLTINTSAMELSPCISGDGLLLLYSRQGIARRMRTDLYEARRNSRDEPFGRGVPLGRLVNSNGSESVSWLSSDGLTLVVRSDRDTGNGQDRLYLTTRASRDVPFHPPLPLIAPINAGDWTGGFTTSADFSTVVIASRRPGGVGGRDLWITRRVRKSE